MDFGNNQFFVRGVSAIYHNLSQFLEGVGSGQFMTVYDIGRGVTQRPKIYDIIFAQPLMSYHNSIRSCSVYILCLHLHEQALSANVKSISVQVFKKLVGEV